MLRRLLYRLQQSKIRKAFAERARRRRDWRAITASNLFDRAWYVDQNPDVRTTGLDPIDHYLRIGSKHDRNPNPLFDRTWYLKRYPDVRLAEFEPLVHYARYGGFEGRDPNPLFDSDWYLAQYPDVQAARVNPLEHYIMHGAVCGLSPNKLFKSRWYIEQYPDACAGGRNPLAHYLANATKGADPNPWFDSSWYLMANPEVAAAGLNPLAHYLLEGAAQGRAPSPLFKGEWYLENMPDVEPSDERLSFEINPLPSTEVQLRSSDKILVDIVADFSCDRRANEKLKSDLGDSLGVGRIVCVESNVSPATALVRALSAAKSRKSHLLVLLGNISITARHAADLADSFGTDPLIGYVVPRLQDVAGNIIPLLGSNETGAPPPYDAGLLRKLPPWQVAPEFLSDCVLIRNDLVCNFPNIVEHFDTIPGAVRAH